MRPAFNGFFALRINERIDQNRMVLIAPLNTGDINHDPTILPKIDDEKNKLRSINRLALFTLGLINYSMLSIALLLFHVQLN